MLWLFVRHTSVYLLDFFCSGIQFYHQLSPYVCFISCLFIYLSLFKEDSTLSDKYLDQYLDLYVLGHGVLI